MTKKNAIFKVLVCVVLLASLLLPAGFAANPVQAAAAKPAIVAKMIIGTGSTEGAFDYYSKENKYTLSVSNADKKATYTFTSSNTKVLTVKASGAKAVLTGLKAGTATITCNQKLNGKTTKIGTCAVTVKAATLVQDYVPVLTIGTSTASEPIEIISRNNDATYTYVSNSKNFTMKETQSKFDGMYFIKHSYTATAAGTYTVTVKETYNKVTRTVATLKYIVKKATVVPARNFDLGSSELAFDLIENCRSDVSYLFDYDEKMMEGYVSEGTTYLKGLAEGTTEVKIYEDTKKPDPKKLIGTCKITIKKVILTAIDCDLSDTETTVGGEPIELYVYKVPVNAPGTVTVTSSNPGVATVSQPDIYGMCIITPVSAGTTTITMTSGSVTNSQTITVTEEDEDY
ncbi:bacterial Ig-like domain protein [Ruminiclostridium hungatei]|uniref:Bacterial Ig-like domain protein n=1 Tax=Ruminiclostridium hungatei TaxID=48256 RepID=A0A1V4SF69_RUMHU|nr:Ig-like domain-containing protein [Ruminiclostridium hungatei]OPX42562.1 bacterial Ig-like domain protein [Ruminiclostridium hungatei]